jgi:glycosyltransferase involved in cell wall biosynthesis
MDRPFFSIITPTYRRPFLLQRAIRSVMNQTFNDYEHIIVDDANDEETRLLVNRLVNKQILFYQHKSSKGAGGARNTGIQISRGKRLMFLDDDDEYMPLFLEKMYDFFSKANKNIGFGWTGISRIKDTDAAGELLFSRTWPSAFSAREQGLAEATSVGIGFGVCVRRECIDTIGLFDESLKIGEDTDFLFRLVQKYEFGTIPEILIKIHQHDEDQLTNNSYIRIAMKEKIMERYHDFLADYLLVHYMHYKNYADLCYQWKLRRKGRKAMFSIIKNSPFRFLNFLDLFLYEVSGKDTITLYKQSIFKKAIRFLKIKNSFR